MSDIRVTVWNENRHEQRNERVAAIYPEGIHGALAVPLRKAGFQVRTATLDEPEHGLSAEILNTTDVLTWWGHLAHSEVSDEVISTSATTCIRWYGADRAPFGSLLEAIQAFNGNKL